jgi:hypothetical protein
MGDVTTTSAAGSALERRCACMQGLIAAEEEAWWLGNPDTHLCLPAPVAAAQADALVPAAAAATSGGRQAGRH